MTPAGKGAQVKRVPPSRSTATAASRAGNKKAPSKVDATATKRSAPTKKKAAPVVKKAATVAKKPASPSKKAAAAAPKKAASAPAKKSVTTKKAAPAARKSAPVAKKAAPTKKSGATPAAAKKAADKSGAKKAATGSASAASKAAASANGAAAAPAARTTFSPKPKSPPPVRPKTGPYAKDIKFLDEVRELLQADRAHQEQATSSRAEADSLALEREPGDVQFDEESGEGGTVTVDRERNLALSGQATLAVEEIDDALRRIDDKTYGHWSVVSSPSEAPSAGAAVRPSPRGLQERRAVAALTRSGVLAFAIAAVVVVADRVTTALATDRLHGVRHVWGPFGLALTYNSGFAFSLFSGRAIFVTVLLCVGVVVLAFVVAQVRTVTLAVGSGLVLGGAIGNLSERIVGGHSGQVPDFITLEHWPTFNLAERCATWSRRHHRGPPLRWTARGDVEAGEAA